MLRLPLFGKLRRTPLRQWPGKALRVFRRMLQAAVQRRRRGMARGYTTTAPILMPLLARPLAAAELRARLAERLAIGARNLAGEFNLLGSGWIRVAPGAPAAGFEGIRYASQTDHAANWPGSIACRMRYLRHLISADHPRVEWHADFKSGFRWPAAAPCERIRYGEAPGADVKVPWEIGRLQHLPLLASLGVVETLPDGRDPAIFRQAARDSLLDFLAENPPGYGVQWCCTMDVAIRAANLLLAADILRVHHHRLDHEAEAAVAQAALEHGRHIMAHIEWSDGLRGNHFLCNLAGLLFCAASLPPSRETDAWLVYAAGNLSKEAVLQFEPDGSNFEASTSYHRLSTETLLFAAAAGLAVPPERWRRALRRTHPWGWTMPGWPDIAAMRDQTTLWPPEFWQRLVAAIDVDSTLQLADGRVAQFGDNDSGRFCKLDPAITLDAAAGTAGEEDGLDHRHLIGAARGFFGTTRWREAGGFVFDGAILAALRGSAATPAVLHNSGAANPAAATGLGIYVWRKANWQLAVRCGQNGQRGAGGHAHNDQLSFELWIDDRPILVNPGTYVYTPSPEARTRFRKTSSHNTIAIEGREQNRFLPGTLFALSDDARAIVTHMDQEGFAGRHEGFGTPHTRTFRFQDDCIEIEDDCAILNGKTLNLLLHPGLSGRIHDNGRISLTGAATAVEIEAAGVEWRDEPAEHSPSYGRLLPARRLCGRFSARTLRWRVRIGRQSEL